MTNECYGMVNLVGINRLLLTFSKLFQIFKAVLSCLVNVHSKAKLL